MTRRIDYMTIAPNGLNKVMAMEGYLAKESTIEQSLAELIKIRVSQINGCAFCLHMHTADARKNGETEQRIYLLNAWKETSIYTAKEKAALALAEAITLISTNGVSDELYEVVRTFFNEKEFTDLVLAISQINVWNRISISMANPVD
ncbi:carboxymuconolactone decarboxylase family protein [Kurthia sibirica]|uniref:Carboxymuconolactone decarboxylase-like domain-containing protein n=1 Tax=Kurthia sibirica TaxID=202750 RepID=A0A2U3AP49_9BACL|nr:carboxymuconolactone decarboxylase family protein [Kurthia sibirica]PWI26314.1 hypothetical protein DEX24_02975 [Kurthia sibirica]GEK35017.1 hypothetical protein KSI01_25500 [Kurthia sibirica]